MKRLVFLASFFLLFFPPLLHAQSPEVAKPTFVKAKVESVREEGEKQVGNQKNLYQNLSVKILDGKDKGKTLMVTHGGDFTITKAQKVTPGQTVVLMGMAAENGQTRYTVSDTYRLPTVWIILALFFLVVILMTGRKGLGAILGLLISLAIIMWFLVPQILAGRDALTISIISSIFILSTTIYLAHGMNKQTTIAVVSTGISLVISALLSIIAVKLTHLSGLGSEDAYSLQQGFGHIINFEGLLLGGIIIGTLGVLDDVTTTQSATISELAKADTKATVPELFQKGMRVGREHITSLVNTLVLAYAGASIGVFIFLSLGLQTQAQPLWVMLNSEVIVEEIIRALSGSLGLILAVPITTFIAAFFAKNTIKIT